MFINLKDLTEKEIVSGFKARFIHSKNMTCSYWTVSSGAALPAHSHLHEQITNVIEGEFELTIDRETKILAPGMTAIISSNILHSGRAITDCKIIDVFYPVREDYRNAK